MRLADQPRSLVRSAGQRVPAVLLVLLSILVVQIGAAFGKTLFGALGPNGAAFLRIASAALILLAVYRPSIRKRSRRQLLAALAFGLALAEMSAAFYMAVARLPLGIAVTIEFLGPLGVAVAGTRRRLDLLWVGLAAIGLLLLRPAGGGEIDALGVGMALLAGVGWAAYIVLGARLGQVFSGGEGLALALGVAALALLPLGVAEAGPALLNPALLAAGGAVGLISSVIPFSLELAALRKIRPGVFGVLMSLEPAVAAAIGLVVLGERLEARVVGGILLVAAASAGVVRGAPEKA